MPPPVGAPEAYHHGDLRAAMIDATRDALVSSMPEKISLRSLAHQLGVSQPAPYRHFKSREALFEEVAADGFVRLNTALSGCFSSVPQGSIASACSAYIELALNNIGVYRLMFSGDLLGKASSSSALTEASDKSFALLSDIIARETQQPADTTTTLLVWAALHGIVSLKAEGLISGAAGKQFPTAVLVQSLIERLVKAEPKFGDV